ncbi:MAG TPA: hypothetical protein VME43_22115 [Bryobacteraceae bacterium]|nr:hypothetical protein [Bryobacteraceae bacterium]
MLSNQPIRLIERHEQEIAAMIVHSIRHHPELAHLGRLPEPELRERGREILKNLSHWLAEAHDRQLAHEYETLGNTRFEEGVPLHESVRGLFLLKEKMMDFLDEQGTDQDYFAMYAEEQFERRIGRFFDLLTIHLVRGYEKAWRHAPHTARSQPISAAG